MFAFFVFHFLIYHFQLLIIRIFDLDLAEVPMLFRICFKIDWVIKLIIYHFEINILIDFNFQHLIIQISHQTFFQC